jgi:site-specific DNA-cytosine methylase
MSTRTYKALYLFAGIGGGALGFQQAEREYRGLRGRFETICGIDNDLEACRDFETITGSRAVCMDLFDRAQYVAWHGKEPPADWREVTAEDLRAAAGDTPDVVFTSPPCKGFSALLPAKSADTPRYQALNRLTIRGIRLVAEAWAPALILMENVPRITTRGKEFLADIKRTLAAYGYVFQDESHDCGEIGGLGQRRQRYLLIARNPLKCAAFLYKPQRFPLKSIGDIIGPLPMPGQAGRMHELPRLQWRTWMRLALIPAGGDWRDLERCGWEDLRVERAMPGHLGVSDWEKPAATVTSKSVNGTSAAAIADPRCGDPAGTHNNVFRITRWEDASLAVTGANRPNNGAVCVADPRAKSDAEYFRRAYKVASMEETAGTVTGGDSPSAGGICVADPRLQEANGRYSHKYQVSEWNEPSKTIIGQTDIQCGAPSIADPRMAMNGKMSTGGVMEWNQPAGTVTGNSRGMSGSTPSAIADPRLGCAQRSGTYGVMRFDEPASTVSGNLDVHAGAAAVADVRIPEQTEAGQWVIISLDGTWHRPLTTWELAMLQGLPQRINGEWLQLCGSSDGRWRERIGNMVPVGAARGIANAMLDALLANEYQEIMYAAVTELWVKIMLARVGLFNRRLEGK